MRIKVEVTKIIESLEKKDTEARAEYAKALAAYEKEIATYGTRLAAGLKRLAAKVAAGEISPEQFDRICNDGCRGEWRRRFDLPKSPDKPSKPSDHAQRIRRLQMCNDKVLSLDESEFRSFGL